MTWSTNDGVASTVNLSHSNGAETIFILKRLLKNEGWTVLESSDGTTYNGSGDQITTASSGAGGMDNSSAWFRIEDPASLREYIFQRGVNSYTWIWRYSASDGFTDGDPDETTLPTANDQQGLSSASATSQVLFPSSGTWKAHMAAQDAAHNGVYSWWLCAYTTSEKTFMCCEAIDSTSTSNDSDPCIHYGSDDKPTYTNLCSSISTTNPNSFRGWMRYGEDDEQWSGVSGTYYFSYSNVPLWPLNSVSDWCLDPHDSKVKTMPIHWYRHGSTESMVGYKGKGKYLRYNPANTTYGYADLLQDGSDYWMVFGDLLLPGWPDGTLPST